MEPGRRGVLVTPHARGMTAEFVEPAFSITGVFFLGAFQLRKR